jgi:hypothetical protein
MNIARLKKMVDADRFHNVKGANLSIDPFTY